MCIWAIFGVWRPENMWTNISRLKSEVLLALLHPECLFFAELSAVERITKCYESFRHKVVVVCAFSSF